MGGLNVAIEALNVLPFVDIPTIGGLQGGPAVRASAPREAFKGYSMTLSVRRPARYSMTPVAANEDTRPTGGRFGNQGSVESTTTRVEVDFRNMPRGARHRVQAGRDADVEVTTGYAHARARSNGRHLRLFRLRAALVARA